jgi:hypothetical protein
VIFVNIPGRRDDLLVLGLGIFVDYTMFDFQRI